MKMKKITLSIFAVLAMSFGSFAQTLVLPYNAYGSADDYQLADGSKVPSTYTAQVGDLITVHVAGTSNFDMSKFQLALVDTRANATPTAYFSQLTAFNSFGVVTANTAFDYTASLVVTQAAAGAGSTYQKLVFDGTSTAAGGTAGSTVTLTLSTYTVTITPGSANQILLPNNGTAGQYQASFTNILALTPAVKVGDVVEVTLSGTSNIDVSNLQAIILDETAAANYYKELSSYTFFGPTPGAVVGTDITAGTPFTLVADVLITAAPTGTGAGSQNVRIYGESTATIGITVTSFTAVIKSVGINEVSAKTNNFAIYPNPLSNGEVNFHETISNIYIYNTQGALVKSVTQANSVDVSDLAHGLYIMKSSKGISKFIISE